MKLFLEMRNSQISSTAFTCAEVKQGKMKLKMLKNMQILFPNKSKNWCFMLPWKKNSKE